MVSNSLYLSTKDFFTSNYFIVITEDKGICIRMTNESERAKRSSLSLIFFLQNVLTTELLLRLLHDLQELLESDTAIARDIGLVDDLVDVSLLFRKKRSSE